jgi:hypothetical protein
LYRDTLKTSKNLHEFHYIKIILNCWHNLQDKNQPENQASQSTYIHKTSLHHCQQ